MLTLRNRLAASPRTILTFALAFLAFAGCDDGGGPSDNDVQDDTTVDVVPDVATDSSPDTTADTRDTAPDTLPDGEADGETDVSPLCGNGVLDDGEACDGDELDGATCESAGFEGGTLGCTAQCELDTSGCTTTEPVCGDGVVEGDEQCDDADLGGESCASLGEGSGTLGCSAQCTFDTSGCSGPGPVCGDGVVEGDEVCDGADLQGADCVSQSFERGTLGCLADCSGYDTSACALCGNNALEPGEVCDSTNLDGATCESEGFAGGTLACAAGCEALDTSGCNSCGDGVLDPGEDCDGGALGGQTCASQGFTGGTLGCTAQCTFDTSACTSLTCPNGTIDPGEECEGLNHNGETCESLGFDGGGGLVCRANCTFDTSGCIMCGDNTREGAEVCDGTALNGQTCISMGFPGGTLGCASDCSGYDTSGCIPVPECGNNVREVGEFCDGTDTSGVRCATLGFVGGTIACRADCGGYDTSGCQACVDDPREDDDTRATATLVSAGTIITDGTICSGDADWFAIDLGEGDSVVATLEFVHADGDLELWLYGPDGTLAAASTSGTDDEVIAYTVPVGQGGRWTVRVSATGSRSNQYSLELAVTPFVVSCPADDLHEENDDQPRGALIASGQVYTGILCAGDTIDWYRVVLNEGDTITVDLDFVHADGDLDLFLYREGPTPAASSVTSNDGEQILSYVVPPGMGGTYGILVTGEPNRYSLAVDILVGSVCGDGVLEGSEECDGTNFGGETCVTQGFVSGILQCTSTCEISTAGCSMSLACPGDDSYEPNDSNATGFMLPAGGGVVNGIMCNSNEDHFRVEALPGQQIRVDLYFTHASGNLNLALVANNNLPLQASQSTTDNESIVYTVPANAASPYGIRIFGGGTGINNTYTLQVQVTGP